MRTKLLCSLAVLAAFTSSSACGSCGSAPAARGSAGAIWSITVLGQAATCAQVGAASVSLLLHSRASGEDTLSSFPCADAEGTPPPVLAGAYDATLALHAADGTALAAAPTQAGVMIAAAQATALRPAVFLPSNRGKLALSFAALATRANCTSTDQGGAGLTGFAIDFEHAADGCAPVTFIRARDATTLGTYTVNCGSPAVASCIERDETLTIDGIESGPYAINVTALRGSIRCWAGTDILSIPGGAVRAQPIQLAPQQAPGC